MNMEKVGWSMARPMCQKCQEYRDTKKRVAQRPAQADEKGE